MIPNSRRAADRSRRVSPRGRGVGWLCWLAWLAPVGVLLAGDPSVSIRSPRHLATVLGPTTIEVTVSPPPGVRVARLELFVDGQPLTTLTAPPWRAQWDAGDGSQGHVIEAKLFLADGNLARSVVRTSPLRINETLEVDLVSLYPVVRDGAGNYVKDLTRDDFRILENGAPQTIQRFTTEHRPLRVGIVLDTSLSMAKQNKLESAQKAALGFLEVLLPQDEGMVVTFDDEVRVVQEITSDKAALATAIAAARAEGGTALYDAIWRAARRLEAFDGRRVMVLLSDGRDEAANGFEPGSLHTLDEALTQALRSEVMVFAIGLGRNLDDELAREWTRSPNPDPQATGVSLKEILHSVADATGGRLLLSPSPGKLRRAFNAVAEDLRNQYSIAYAPSDEASPGSYREITVLVPRRDDVEVIVRKGYFTAE